MTATSLNFALLDANRPEVARLIAAMVQARDAVEHRSWLHPQEPSSEEWWADVLADPRARKRDRRTDLAVKRAHYRLADEKREIILVACSKCDWRAAFERDELITAHGADYVMPNLLNYLAARIAVGSALNGIAAACTTSSPSKRTSANLLGCESSQLEHRRRPTWRARRSVHPSRGTKLENPTEQPERVGRYKHQIEMTSMQLRVLARASHVRPGFVPQVRHDMTRFAYAPQRLATYRLSPSCHDGNPASA